MYSPFIIISSPSGGGKSTVTREIIKSSQRFRRPISATTRPARPQEKSGKDYYFLSAEEFRQKIQNNQFLEWEEVYPNTYYGTLVSEIELASQAGKVIILPIDVHGALELKQQFGSRVLTIFLDIPDIQTLKHRLINRNSEDESSLQQRLNRVDYELKHREAFDKVVINDDIDTTVKLVKGYIEEFLQKHSF